jgi:hypothetical protein
VLIDFILGFIVFVPCGEEDTSKALNEHLISIATLTDGCVVTNQKMKDVHEARLTQLGRRLVNWEIVSQLRRVCSQKKRCSIEQARS